MKIEEHAPADRLTTLKVGGTVRYVITIESRDEVREAIGHARSLGYPLVPFGDGSNVLLPDGELAVTLVRFGVQVIVRNGDMLHAAAGARWDDVVVRAVHEKLWGVENLSGIPGTVGGAVVQNIGAYGAALSDTLQEVEAYDHVADTFVTFDCTQCACGYRTTIFKTEKDRYLILSATLSLSARPAPNVVYKDLAAQFRGLTPQLVEVRAAVLDIRSRKFPPLSTFGTAGSFFLNPVVSAAEAARMEEKYPGMPTFVLPEGGVKIPIGWHFEHVLKLRGHRVGAVEAWREQSLVIVAHPGATAREVRAFADAIACRVHNELGIVITPEVRIL